MDWLQIFLPTGTEVGISLNTGHESLIDVFIHPGLADIERTSGLCGNFDGDWTNDNDTLRHKYE